MAQAVSEFQQLLVRLSGEMQTRIEQFVASVQTLDVKDLMPFITDAGPALLTPFIQAAADLTATWYEAQDPNSDYVAIPADLPSVEDLAIAARWAMTQADPAAAWTGAATNTMFEASRKTVIDNATAEGVKWARFAKPTACAFCKVLALNGYYYDTEQDAKSMTHGKDELGHSRCTCTVFPERGPKAASSEFLRNYEVHLKQWKEQYDHAKTLVSKTKQIPNVMEYMPGGRRYKGDSAPPYEPRPKPVNLDKPAPKPAPEPAPGESDASIAKRQLPGMEKSLSDLRAKGIPDSDPRIQWHLAQIARFKKALAAAK